MEELMVMKQKKYSKLLKTWRVVKLTTLNWCTGQVIMSILTLLDLDCYPGRGLKILTPCQMLSSLPISLAQLKAGNNSEKLKNEIRQLFYSLYIQIKKTYKTTL